MGNEECRRGDSQALLVTEKSIYMGHEQMGAGGMEGGRRKGVSGEGIGRLFINHKILILNLAIGS